MKWKKLDHIGSSWGYSGDDDVIVAWIHHGRMGWDVTVSGGQPIANKYASKQAAQAAAEKALEEAG